VTEIAAGSGRAVQALRDIAFQLERTQAPTYRVRAFRRAAEVVKNLPPGELEHRLATDTLLALPGIGPATAGVIAEAARGERPSYLDRLPAAGRRCGPRCAAIATRTPTGPTAAARRERWPRPPATSATSGSP
jgi:hypothetical protein